MQFLRVLIPSLSRCPCPGLALYGACPFPEPRGRRLWFPTGGTAATPAVVVRVVAGTPLHPITGKEARDEIHHRPLLIKARAPRVPIPRIVEEVVAAIAGVTIGLVTPQHPFKHRGSGWMLTWWQNGPAQWYNSFFLGAVNSVLSTSRSRSTIPRH